MSACLRYAALASGLFLLAGCIGGTTPPPQDHYYRLPPVSAASAASGVLVDTLAVESMQTDGVHHERAILYVQADSTLELRRYHYHLWVLPPSQLVQEHLIGFLRERRLAERVLRARPRIEARARISGYLKRFERVIDNGAIRVDVELELQYIKDDEPVLVREYRRTPRVRNDSMAATVQVFGKALESIFVEFSAALTE